MITYISITIPPPPKNKNKAKQNKKPWYIHLLTIPELVELTTVKYLI